MIPTHAVKIYEIQFSLLHKGFLCALDQNEIMSVRDCMLNQ